MSIRLRTRYRRYRFWRRLRLLLAAIGGIAGIYLVIESFLNSPDSGALLTMRQIAFTAAVAAIGFLLPWLLASPFVRRPD